jgi:WD40 repeat protein
VADDAPPSDAVKTLPEAPISSREPTLAAATDSAPPGPAPTATAQALLAPSHPEDLLGLASADGAYLRGPELARGGMGRILYGRDLRHGRPVAIKELLLDGDAAARRFEREALITARLEHPSIVPVYQAGRDAAGRPFYAMRMVSGRALHTVIAETQTFDERLALLPAAIAVADAMGYAHARRIVHRDLKPANILVGPFGETVIIDWGLAKDLTAPTDAEGEHTRRSTPIAPGLTRAGSAMGTPAYMAPEQAAGTAVDERSDVYAIGATLYHILAGLAPFADQQTGRDLLTYVVTERPTPLAALEPRVPADLRTIVDKAMAREPSQRYATAQELAEELRQFQRGNLVDAYAYSPRELAQRWVGRHKLAVALSALALVVALATGSWFARRERTLRATATAAADMASSRRLALLAETGRSELLAGRPLRGLALLTEAYHGGLDTPGLRSLLADATRPLDAVTAIIEPSATVHALALSADGRRVATATDTGVYLRDAETGALEHHLVEGSRVWSVAYDDAGRRLVLAAFDKPAVVLDATTREPVARLPEPVSRAWLSGDGELVVTIRGQSAAVWRVGGAALLARSEHDGLVRDAILSRDGRWLLSIGARGDVVLVRVADGARVATFAADVRAAVLSDDGARAVTGHVDGTLALWSLPAARELHRRAAHGAEVGSLAVAPDGQLLLSTSDDGSARLWDAATLEPRAVLRGHRAAVTGGSFSRDGALVVTTGRDACARVWAARNGRELLTLEHGAAVTVATFAPTGDSVIAGGERGARRFTLATGKLIERIPGAVAGLSVAAFSPDGARIATAGAAGAALFDRGTGERLGALAHDAPLTDLRFDASGARLLTASRDGSARLWDADSGLEIASYAHPSSVLAAGFAGEQVVTVAADGAVRAWSAASGAPGPELARMATPLSLAAVAADGQAALVAEPGARAASLVPLAGAPPIPLAAHRDAVSALAISADGALLLTGGRDSDGRVFDRRDGALVAVLSGHSAAIRGVAFDPAGTRALTASDDGSARLWDPRAGTVLAVLEGHAGAVVAATFSPDGLRALTIGADGDAILWDTHLERRPAEELERLVHVQVPWRVDGDRLVPAR